MNLRQAAQQALEALENDAMQRTYAGGVRIANAAIALRAALAEPEQNPFGDDAERYARKLHEERESYKALFTAPTPRKPLTDDEIGKIAGDCLDAWSCARAIERAHGIGEQT